MRATQKSSAEGQREFITTYTQPLIAIEETNKRKPTHWKPGAQKLRSWIEQNIDFLPGMEEFLFTITICQHYTDPCKLDSSN